MSESLSSTQEMEQVVHKPRGGRWRGITVVFAVVLLAAACGLAYLAASNSRYKVVVNPDYPYGYQIEYTISSRYRQIEVGKLVSEPHGAKYSFWPKPPPQALQWIYNNIFHRTTPPPNSRFPGWEQGGINQYCFGTGEQSEVTINQEGYPELPGILRSMANLTVEKMLVSGCPATSFQYSSLRTSAPMERFYLLVVKPRDQYVIYAFLGLDSVAEPTGVADEMVKIKDSIRITKVR